MGVTKPKKKNKIHFVYLNKPEMISLSLDFKGVKGMIKSINSGKLDFIDLKVSDDVVVKGRINNCVTGMTGINKLADKSVNLRERDLVIYLISPLYESKQK